jgi:DNA-binding PadR family transcriptional regulator
MTMDRVELILRMAQNKAEEGKEKTAEINAIGAAYLAEVRELLAMARDAVETLERQEQRFAHFDPNRRVTHTNQPAITQLQRTNGEPKDGRAAS